MKKAFGAILIAIILIVCVAGLGLAPLWISNMIGDSVLPLVSIFQ